MQRGEDRASRRAPPGLDAKGLSGNNCGILAADASRLAALLIACRVPLCALFAPGHPGASTPRDATVIPGQALT